jgi:hypothetical protein
MAFLGVILAAQLWQLYGAGCYEHYVDTVVNGIRVKYDMHMDHFRTHLFLYSYLTNDVHREYIARDICIGNADGEWPDMTEYLLHTHVPSPHLAKQLHLRRDLLFYLMCHWMDITKDIVWSQISKWGWHEYLIYTGSGYTLLNRVLPLVPVWGILVQILAYLLPILGYHLAYILPKIGYHLAYRGVAWIILHGSPDLYWGWHQLCMLCIPSWCCIYTYDTYASMWERLLMWRMALFVCLLMQYAYGVVHHTPYTHGVLLCIATDIYVV